jgi:hypothetical protein
MPLIPFGAAGTCPKCDRWPRSTDVRYCQDHHIGQVPVPAFEDAEHLDLICPTCGYVRLMATADRTRAQQERIVSA